MPTQRDRTRLRNAKWHVACPRPVGWPRRTSHPVHLPARLTARWHRARSAQIPPADVATRRNGCGSPWGGANEAQLPGPGSDTLNRLRGRHTHACVWPMWRGRGATVRKDGMNGWVPMGQTYRSLACPLVCYQSSHPTACLPARRTSPRDPIDPVLRSVCLFRGLCPSPLRTAPGSHSRLGLLLRKGRAGGTGGVESKRSRRFRLFLPTGRGNTTHKCPARRAVVVADWAGSGRQA